MGCKSAKEFQGKKYRIVFEQKTVTSKGTTGANVETWATLTTVWAKPDWMSGNENEEDTKLTGKTKVNWLIRKNTTIAKDIELRVLFESQYYNIRAYLEMEGRKFWKVRTELIE